MCGIAGYLGSLDGCDLSPQQLLTRMLNAIAHRGPDERGLHVEPGLGLGHVRLSIIDLAAGQQPMADPTASHWLSFNGEIFNYRELRRALADQGHTFRTASDTEVLLHQYAHSGTECLQAFNGDFAFALWDRSRQQLLLARDRLGVRPLYYAHHRGTLFFASEIKALLQVPTLAATLDPMALDQIFTFWFPLPPRTPFQNISELPPGHFLLARHDTHTIRPYWQLSYPDRHEPSPLSRHAPGELAEQLRELLLDATRLRLRADVPVGAYLSGGLDSSIITALIRRFSNTPLRSFSVAFEDQEFDESAFQRHMVAALGTEHSSLTVTRRDIGRLFPAVIRHTERPILRSAPAPLFALAQLVRQHHFKVVLTGEGADELLAGYDLFKEAKVRRFWARQPHSSWRPLLLRRLYPYLSNLQNQPQAYLQAFFGAGLADPADPFFSHRPRWAMTARLKAFFNPDLRQQLRNYDAIEELRAQLPEAFARWHPLSQAQYLETAYLLPGYILSSQGDRVAMAHAVEGRFPFLDHRLATFAAQVPPHWKLLGLTEKHLLRQGLARDLPTSIARRPKQPYRAPDSASFLGPDTPDYVTELLSPSALADSGYFDPAAVAKLVHKCRHSVTPGFRDNMALVGILSVQLLHAQFIRHNAPLTVS